MNKYIKSNNYYQNKQIGSSIKKYNCSLKYQDTYTGVSNIYAIGDIHGDCSVLIKLLKKIKLINSKLEWIGKDTHLVQLGDILDGFIRHDILSSHEKDSIMALEEFTILELLNDLDQQARKVGGRVHYLIGNHELMNVIGDFSYVLSNHMSDISHDLRKTLFQPGGYMAQMLACHSYSVLKINDWIFCHGGLLPIHLKNIDIPDKITYINDILRNVLLNNVKLNELSEKDMNTILGDDGIYWTRHYKFDTNKCNTLENTLQIINNDKKKRWNDFRTHATF